MLKHSAALRFISESTAVVMREMGRGRNDTVLAGSSVIFPLSEPVVNLEMSKVFGVFEVFQAFELRCVLQPQPTQHAGIGWK